MLKALGRLREAAGVPVPGPIVALRGKALLRKDVISKDEMREYIIKNHHK